MCMSEDINEFNIGKFDLSRSLFIEASAGTGKTYTIQLMVAKMISKGTPLKKILIVTYTEKAAGELKDRIRKKIDEVLEKGRIDEDQPALNMEQMGFFRKAYQDVDNAAIFTIHSFCQKALKEYAYDANRPFDMAMVDDSAVEDMIDRFVRDRWNNNEQFVLLLQAAEKTSSFINDLKKTFIKSANMYKGVDGSGEEIVKLDEVQLPKQGDSDVPEDIVSKVLLAQCLEDLYVIPNFEDSVKAFEAVVENDTNVDLFVSQLRNWIPGKKLYDGKKFRSFKDPLKEPFDQIKKVNAFVSSIAKSFKHKFYAEHTPELFSEWQKYKSESKLQSFNDMILSVHRAVMEPGNSLKTRLRAQYTYAIIDEFQDTNQLQWDIFRTVFLKDGKVPVNDHRIFVVGDPKQSIYSFQGADVNVYKKATDEIGKKLDLVHNFRSTDGIIEGCNALFAGTFFNPAAGMPELVKFTKSYPPDGKNADKKKPAPELDGAVVEKAILLSKKNIAPKAFAATVVANIIDWCSLREDGKTTRLQVFDKDYGKPGHDTPLRNVTFKDFAILAKSRSEMEDIEGIMRSVGVPYTRYKEGNLFRSRECAEWISLFRAINAPDFSSWNRQILSEVLITDFFKDVVAERERARRGSDQSNGLEELHYIESDEFDDPNNPERRQIASWRSLALKFRYAEMLERIYADSQIEYRLMDVSKLQSLARLRQIGNYAVDYLYNHRCSMDDLVRHLQGLARYEQSADDENGDLVEKGSDFKAVQVMTIHASKGLEFPVVISIAGFKRLPNSTPPFITHDETDALHLGFDDTASAKRKNEELEEWKRLFYVDFTRASSLLLIPQYNTWFNEAKDGESPKRSGYFKHVHALMDALDKFTAESQSLYTELPTNDKWIDDPVAFKEKDKLVREILDSYRKDCNPEELNEIEEQKQKMSALQGKIAGASILQYSYSTLAGRVETPIAEPDDSRTDKEESDDTEEIPVSGIETYPRGSKVGDALHNILERTRFHSFGEDYETLDDALQHPTAELVNTIDEEFKAQSLPIAAHEQEWREITIRFVWNTLHAALPEIAGADILTEKPFKLVKLLEGCHKPEVQFGMNADAKNSDDDSLAILHRVCKGFIDLLFVRPDSNGKKRYSILDWKSDTLDSYSDAEVKAKVDNEYSVQRVLYSYCLIQWLKQFYGKGTSENLSEDEIYKQYFGGIYYAFLRGTDGETSRGIYAHTWKNFEALKSDYEEVKGLMSKKRKN